MFCYWRGAGFCHTIPFSWMECCSKSLWQWPFSCNTQVRSQPCNSKKSTEGFRKEGADWKKSKEMSELLYTSILHLETEQATDIITVHIINAAHSSIPRVSVKTQNRPRQCWNEECRNVRKEQTKAWGTFTRYLTSEDFIAFKRVKAKGRCVRHIVKAESWNLFRTPINSFRDTHKVWKTISALGAKLEYPTTCQLNRWHNRGSGTCFRAAFWIHF